MRQESERHLPYDIEVEQAVLGAILVDNRLFFSEGMIDLRPEHFYDPLHQRLFEVMARKVERDVSVTPLSLHAALKSDPGLVEVGGQGYLAGLAQAAPALPRMRDLARLLIELAARRTLITIGEEIVAAAFEPPGEKPVTEIADAAGERLFHAVHQNGMGGEGAVSIRDLAERAARSAEAAMNTPASVCLSTGLTDVDLKLGGLYRGDLTVLGGAPNMGKTSLAQHIAKANGQRTLTAPEAEKPGLVLFFSLEMAGEQVGTRELASAARVPSDRMRSGRINAEEMARVAQAAYDFPDLPYKIDAGRRLTCAQMRARAQAYRRREKREIALILIDNLRLIRPANPRDSEPEQLQQITMDLTDLAKELNAAVLLLSHVNREFAKRDNKRPQLQDLYGSSAIEQNADAVWFLHREYYYLSRNMPDAIKDPAGFSAWGLRCENEEGWAEIYATKQRMGRIGQARVRFEEEFTEFKDSEPPVDQAANQAALELWHGGNQ